MHDEAKDKAFELEMSWVCDESKRQHEKVISYSTFFRQIMSHFSGMASFIIAKVLFLGYFQWSEKHNLGKRIHERYLVTNPNLADLNIVTGRCVRLTQCLYCYFFFFLFLNRVN